MYIIIHITFYIACIIKSIHPNSEHIITVGTAYKVSFKTPEKQVYGVEPVKFNAKYAINEVSKSPFPKYDSKLGEIINRAEKIITTMDQNTPSTSPFKEKALKGKYGNKIGNITVPINIAMK